jgi:hypothetical protein
MSDLLPDTTSLESPTPILPELSGGINVSAIDQNLRAIKHVESTWRLPTLPDVVRLDLASFPGIQHQNLTQFLYGLDRDLRGEDDDDGLPTAQAAPLLTVQSSVGQFSPLAVGGFAQASSYLSQLRGLKPSEVLDADATQRWKLRAIERGYMDAPEGGVVDGTWSPELYAVQRQMQFDDYDQSLRGNRFGALPLLGDDKDKGVLDILNDWTSPSGLMRAATDLDLWWDFGQVGKEFSSWGDKWAKVGKSDSPLDFAKNLIDAVTGPLDDVVVPALNMALLFTGIGAATNYARLAVTGARAWEAAETFNFAAKLYEVPRIGRALGATVGRVFPAVQDVRGLAAPSMMANRLSKSAGAVGKLGDTMAAWRALPQVAGTRGLVQTGMKLGFVSQAEKQFLPSFEGKSLADVPAVADMSEKVLRNMWVTSVGEVLFTPYTMFEAGTFTRGGLQVVRNTWSNLGSAPGRAALGAVAGMGAAAVADGDTGDVLAGAALGAAAGAAAPAIGRGIESLGHAMTWKGKPIPFLSKSVRGAGKTLALTNFEAIGNDQKMTNVFMSAVRSKMEPEQWAQFEQKIGENGFLKAYADHAGFGDDVQGASAAMTFVMLSAAIDRTAALQAGARTSEAGWFYRYHLARNKLVSQLRYFDGDIHNEDVVWAIVSKESDSIHGARKRFDDYMSEIEADPTNFAEALAAHNEQAVLTLRQLLSPENLPLDGLSQSSLDNMRPLFSGSSTDADHEALIGYVANTLDSFGRWGDYQPTLQGLNDAVQQGMFADARLTPAVSYMGTNAKLNLVEYMPEWSDDVAVNEMGGVVSRHINDTFFLDKAVTIDQARRAGFHVNPLAAEISPTRSRITLAKAETVTKQELRVQADELQRTINAYEGLSKAAQVMVESVDEVTGAVTRNALIHTPEFVDLTTAQLNQQLQALGYAGKPGSEVRKLHRVLNHAKASGFDVSGTPELVMRQYLDHLDNDIRWSTRYGQPVRMVSSEQKVQGGIVALKARRKELLLRANRTAAEVDTEDLLNKIALKHGADEAYEVTVRPGLFSDADEAAQARSWLEDDLATDPRLSAEQLKTERSRLQSNVELNKMMNERYTGGVDQWRLDEGLMKPGATKKSGTRRVPNPDTDEYRQAQAMIEDAKARGYKIVYGQEFLMPNDLAMKTGLFTDINERHMNAMTLGNFFGRRHPAELAANVQIARQRAIARQLSMVYGTDVDPSDDRILHATQDLYRLIIDPEEGRNWALLDDIAHQTFLDKIGTSVRTSGQIRGVQDLGLGKHRTRVMEALQKVGWSEDEAHAIWRGMREGRYAEWRDQGLYAIEAKLRKNNQILQALHILGGTENAGRLRQTGLGMGAGALVGGAMGQASADEGESGRLEKMIGMAAGAVVGAGVGKAANKAAQALDHSQWARYGYVADWLAATRDRMRFSLSPFFDASRYTEAWTLGQIAAPQRLEDGTRMVMPFNQSPKTLAKRLRKELGPEAAAGKIKQIESEFANAARGKFDPAMLEESQRQFQEIGLLGFNPTRWMMSTFHYLRENGMDVERAYETVREMYTYGTRSRSAFEQSVNFVFFPFSFAKKTVKHAAQFLSDDLMRSVMLHDAVKMYELLDENYDLSGWAEEHLPVLQRMKQLNMFAFGISPGRLGGVNAPFIDAAIGDPLSLDPAEDRKGLIFNMFTPIGVNLGGDGVDKDELWKVVRRSIPIMNDIQYMAQNLKDQGHVMFDPSHKTRAAQARDGYDEWGEYVKGVKAALDDYGASWYDLHNNPGMVGLKAEYLAKKAELERKYPGWAESRLQAQANRAELEQERELRTNTALYTPEEATRTDIDFLQFEQMLAGYKDLLGQYGITDWQEMDPADFAYVRGVAIEMAAQNPGFQMVYDKFYQRDFGPIGTVVR